MPFEARLTRLLIDRLLDADAAIARMNEIIDHWRPERGTAIAKASQVVLEGPALSGEPVVLIRDIFRTVNDHAARSNITGVKWDNNVETLRRPYKFTPNQYGSINVQSIWYMFRGDVAAVSDILTNGSQRIGPLRAKGGSEIESVAVDVAPNRSSMFGIICGGKLLRPVPARIEHALPSSEYINGMVENWHIPYWETANKELCLVPVQAGKHTIMSVGEIRELVV
jgi:hypothetical protein